MVRTPYVDENGIRKGAWSREEDDKLREHIQKYALWNWHQVPRFARIRREQRLSRCGKSCRLRWMNYLRPNLKHGNYTKQEEDLILELHEKHGNRWSLIAAKLPGRTDNEVKNYWHAHLKKQSKRQQIKFQFKEGCSETSQTDINATKFKELEFVPDIATNPCGLPKLESSQLPSEEPCSDQSSHPSSGSAPVAAVSAGTNWIAAEDSCTDSVLAATSDDSIGDFWTQPFVTDNLSCNSYQRPLSFEEEGFLCTGCFILRSTNRFLYIMN